MSRSARAAAWEAQRAAWKLANRGDTHLAADRRLYKLQMKELRKEWLEEDRLARRAAYVANREKYREREEQKKATEAVSLEFAETAADLREEKQRMHALRLEQKAKRDANLEKLAVERGEKRREAETDFRKRWLQDMLSEYDVDGRMPLNALAALDKRKRAWLTPENFDKRLHMLMVRPESPVKKWDGIARRLQEEEEREMLAERQGGRLQQGSAAAAAVGDRGAAGARIGGAAEMTPGDSTGPDALRTRSAPAPGLLGGSSRVASGEPSLGNTPREEAFLADLREAIGSLDELDGSAERPDAAVGGGRDSAVGRGRGAPPAGGGTDPAGDASGTGEGSGRA